MGTGMSTGYFTLTPQDVKSIADGTCKTEGELPFGEIVEANISQWEYGRELRVPRHVSGNLRYRMSFVVDPGYHIIPLQFCHDLKMTTEENDIISPDAWLKNPEHLWEVYDPVKASDQLKRTAEKQCRRRNNESYRQCTSTVEGALYEFVQTIMKPYKSFWMFEATKSGDRPEQLFRAVHNLSLIHI